jgi:hypothetical protein
MPTSHLSGGVHHSTVVACLDVDINVSGQKADFKLEHDCRAAVDRDLSHLSRADQQLAHLTKCRLYILPGKVLNHSDFAFSIWLTDTASAARSAPISRL